MFGALPAVAVGFAFILVRAHARARAIRLSLDIVRRTRDILERPMRYRIAWPSDDDLVRPLRTAAACEILTSNGFVHLGDLVGVPEGGPAWSVARIYVDSAGTTIASVVRSAVFHGPTQLALVSYASDAAFRTSRVASWLAAPPSWHRQSLDALTATPQAIQRHRAFCGEAELIAITTAEAMRERLELEHEVSMRWRNAQSPDELLLADVRSLLGARFDRDGHRLIRRLRANVPRATVV